MIGRENEQEILKNCLMSNKAEFLVIYGRRRVGKTYLIKEYFNNQFSFYTTGMTETNMQGQLKAFNNALAEAGADNSKIEDWFEAFLKLKAYLQTESVKRDAVSGKRVVFLDELPWMDTPRSDFKSALEYFWNSWGSSQNDLLLIVCGSATSWIIDNLLDNQGGFYNRVTRRIHLKPFTLRECEQLYQINGVKLTRRQVIDSYMVFGGIPYYMNCFDKRLSLAQNIDELLFKENGILFYEHEVLLKSLFKNHEKHAEILNELSKNKGGITRVALAKNKKIGDGEPLTKALNELEQCGFVRKYKNYTKEKQGFYFQLIDPFMMFSFRFLKNREHNNWMTYINSPSYFAWIGNAFELVVLTHSEQIKKALGISGVESNEYAWRSSKSKPGAQVDLLIDRKDGVINLCEAKYTGEQFKIDSQYAEVLQNKVSAFINETKCKSSVHLTLISASGIKHNEYSGIVQNEIDADALFLTVEMNGR